jgi:hypothetical protein
LKRLCGAGFSLQRRLQAPVRLGESSARGLKSPLQAEACSTMGARPAVLLSAGNQPGCYRVVLDVANDFGELLRTSHPVVVRLRLPEWSCSAEEQVRFTGSSALDALQQRSRVGQRCDQQVRVVGHYRPGVQFVKAIGAGGAVNMRADQCGDIFALQPHRACTGGVEMAVHPDERRTRRQVAGRGITALWETPVKMPGDEQRLSVGIPVREAAPRKKFGEGFHVDW